MCLLGCHSCVSFKQDVPLLTFVSLSLLFSFKCKSLMRALTICWQDSDTDGSDDESESDEGEDVDQMECICSFPITG